QKSGPSDANRLSSSSTTHVANWQKSRRVHLTNCVRCCGTATQLASKQKKQLIRNSVSNLMKTSSRQESSSKPRDKTGVHSIARRQQVPPVRRSSNLGPASKLTCAPGCACAWHTP